MAVTNQRYFKLGLIGHPVSHSISPLLHGAALSFADLPGEYNLIDVEPEKVEERLCELVSEEYAGLNVTVPHKQTVFNLVDELTEQAKKVGAVNTVSIVDGGAKLIGHNTDLGGFTEALRAFLPAAFSGGCLILGAGGAARAAVWAAMELGLRDIGIVARNASQAQALREQTSVALNVFNSHDGVLDADLVINCTPVGLKESDAIPDWIANALRDASYFYDMVYPGRNRSTTPLVNLARAHGCAAVDGTSMLINQAALAFQFWTGAHVPAEVMEKAIA